MDEITAFASKRVLGTLRERYESGSFSRGLWNEMGEMGLLGLTVPPEYGGSGGTGLDLAVSIREFALAGCDLGLTLSWITHLALCVKSIEAFGTEGQKIKYLPRLASGELVGAAAVSEPKTGAHPGGMQTTASRTATGFVLDGRKIYITDGPVAELLVVIAVTGKMPGGNNELTAFLVETSMPGFGSKRMDLDFLRTSPHGELAFEGVELGEDQVLGSLGEGHSRNSKGAFARERSLVLCALPGLFESAAGEAADRLLDEEGAFGLEGGEAYSWMHHMSALQAYRKLTESLVEVAFEDPERWRSHIDTVIYLGISYAKWARWMGDLIAARKLSGGFPLDIMVNDMKLVMIGEGLLLKEGRKRFMR